MKFGCHISPKRRVRTQTPEPGLSCSSAKKRISSVVVTTPISFLVKTWGFRFPYLTNRCNGKKSYQLLSFKISPFLRFWRVLTGEKLPPPSKTASILKKEVPGIFLKTGLKFQPLGLKTGKFTDNNEE